jgi:hypothetical protein
LTLDFQHVSSAPVKAARCNSFAKAGADALVLSEHRCNILLGTLRLIS